MTIYSATRRRSCSQHLGQMDQLPNELLAPRHSSLALYTRAMHAATGVEFCQNSLWGQGDGTQYR